MSAQPQELESAVNKLSINPSPSKSSSAFKSQKKQSVADSWEEEASDSGDDTDRPISPQRSTSYPSAPPPTPISPSYATDDFVSPYGYTVDGPSEGKGGGGRPEKTDAVAKRLIAGALGVRPPKMTEEQRAYDRVVKEKEVKRREKEKEAKAKAEMEAEKAKLAVWDD